MERAAMFGELRKRGTTCLDRKSTRLNSSHLVISYAVFCLKKKNMHHSQAILCIANDISSTMFESCDILLGKQLARPIDQGSEVDADHLHTRGFDQIAYRDG